MARSTSLQYSRNRVDKAGRAIRNGTPSYQDHMVVENFRASHAHILNAFQASLRNRARKADVTVAQRLKRRVTIYDKLVRVPNFSLKEMQDIAGCRLIFNNNDDLLNFRTDFMKARFKHKRISGDRFDYLTSPKFDGYRGIHDAYEYHSRSPEGAGWNKLRIELQYRTVFQHAWATAVEVAGLLTENEHKFGRAATSYQDFFKNASELIARRFEQRTSCLPDHTMSQLVTNFKEIDNEIGLMNLFRQYNNIAQDVRSIGKNVILIFNKQANPGEKTAYHHFDSFSEAVRELEKFERANLVNEEPYDVVLVRSVNTNSQTSIESAFRNYFANTKDFVAYIDECIS